MTGLQARWQTMHQTQDVFIGRQSSLAQFKSLYQNLNEHEVTLLNFYGMGGVGKTTLLAQIEKEAKKEHIPIFRYDCAKHQTLVAFYESLTLWLQQNIPSAIYLPMAFAIYWQRLHPNTAFQENLPSFIEESGLYGDILSAILDDTFEVVKDFIPIAGGVSKTLYKSYRKLVAKYQLDTELVAMIEELKEAEITYIENMLPYFFMHDLQNSTQKISKMPLFIFDTFEKLSELLPAQQRFEAEQWVENFAASIQSNGMLIIAGREPIKWHEQDPLWKNNIFHTRVDTFEYEESKKLISSLGITQENVIEAIAQASKGYPFYIKLAVETYRDNPDIFDSETFIKLKFDGIFKRFAGNLGNEYLAILEYLCIPRSFDKELYVYLVQKAKIGNSDLVFEHITSYSFFTHTHTHFSMHDLMRKSFQERISERHKKDIHKVLFSYHIDKSNITRHCDENIDETALREALYHLMYYAETEEIQRWFNTVKEGLVRYGAYHLLAELYTEAITRTKSEKLKIIFWIETGLLCIELEQYDGLKNTIYTLDHMVVPAYLIDDIAYLKAQRQLYYIEHFVPVSKRENKREKLLQQFDKVILKSDTLELKLRAYTEKANILRKQKLFFEAQSQLFTALKLAPNNLQRAKLLDKLGFLYKDMKQYDQAKTYFLEAIELKMQLLDDGHIELAKSYRGLSHIFNITKQYKEACETTLLAIKGLYAFYGKHSSHLWQEYLKLAKLEEEICLQNHTSLDPVLFLLAKIQLRLANKESYEPLIEELLSHEITHEDMCRVGEIFYQYDQKSAKEWFEKAQIYADNAIQRWQIHLREFFMYRKYKHFAQAKDALHKMLDISVNLGKERYVADLQRAANFLQSQKEYQEADTAYTKAEKELEKEKSVNRKLAQIYQAHASLYIKKDQFEKKIDYLYKASEIYNNISAQHERAEILQQIADIYLKNKRISEAEALWNSILSIYEKGKDKARIDSIYGKMAEFYQQQGEKQKALSCYMKQIEIRKEIGDSVKLAKGYSFLAKYLYNEDITKAQDYLETGLQLLLDAEKPNYEAIHLHSFHLLNLYIKRKLHDKQKTLIDLRIKNAEASQVMHFIIYAYEDLLHYYKKNNQHEERLQVLKKLLGIVTAIRYPVERYGVLEKLTAYYKNKDFQQTLKYQFQMYEIALTTKRLDNVEELFRKIVHTRKQHLPHIDNFFEQQYKMVLGNLIRKKEYRAYVTILKEYKNIYPAKRWYFLFDQIKRIRKKTDNNKDDFYKIYKALSTIKAYPEAALFYEAYFDALLQTQKGKLHQQAKTYETAEPILKKLNNQKVTQRFKERYERFKIRLGNALIINDMIIDHGLQKPLQSATSIPTKVPYPEAEPLLKEFVHLCCKEERLSERITEHKLASSVLMQGIQVLVKEFNPLHFGCETSEIFLRMLLSKTPLRIAKKAGKNAPFIIWREEKTTDQIIPLEDIISYRDFVHTTNNYAVLLSKAFFEGNGLFFSKERHIQEKVYNYISQNSAEIVSLYFDEIHERVCKECHITEDIDKLRTENLIRNFIYADLFLFDHPYKPLETRRLTLKLAGDELLKSLRDYGKKRLNDLLSEEIDLLHYRALWI